MKSASNLSRAYEFRQSGASGTSSLLRMKKAKEDYKYNLFSMLDEGGNNGCSGGCCGSNEVIAPKIHKRAWKE